MIIPGVSFDNQLVEVSNFDIAHGDISNHKCSSFEEARRLAKVYITGPNICMTYCDNMKEIWVKDLSKISKYETNKTSIRMYFWG